MAYQTNWAFSTARPAENLSLKQETILNSTTNRQKAMAYPA